MLFPGLILFMILIIIRPQDFVPAFMGIPVVFGVMSLLAVAWLISPLKKKLLCTNQDRYYALFLAICVLSTVSVNWMQYTVEVAVDTLKLTVIYFIIVTVVMSEFRFKFFTWTILTLITFVACMGILQYNGSDITGAGLIWSSEKNAWQIRGVGVFDNPNDLAYSVVIVVPFALGFLLQSRDIFLKLVALFMLVTAATCIYLTESRGGYLALIVGIITWGYFWVTNCTMRRAALLAGVIVIILAFSIQTQNYNMDKSSMGRIDAWAQGMHMLVTHPLLGVGKGQFIENHERDSHSTYVRAGAELGLVGLFAFIGILYSAFRSLYYSTAQYSAGSWKIYRVGFISYLSSYSVGSIFSTRTYDMIFLVVMALIAVMTRLSVITLQPADVHVAITQEKLCNRNVFGLTLLTIVIWKLFLIQVW